MTEQKPIYQLDQDKPWGHKERDEWYFKQSIKRSYADEVLGKIHNFRPTFAVEQYGELSYSNTKYPLFVVKSSSWDKQKATILITGGVHGYETSGVQGALRFIENEMDSFSNHFNFIVAPCVSPWGYETINRWNANAVDPNRSFYNDSPAQESAALMKMITELDLDFLAHFDLHETTDSDNSIFMPALSSRDGTELIIWEIPDGFYVVGDVENPVAEFQSAIIQSVAKVTHIAPSDNQGKIIGEATSQDGVINYPTKQLGLCTGFTNSQFCTTTEVYPDSVKVTDEICINAQLAAIKGGLEYLIKTTI